MTRSLLPMARFLVPCLLIACALLLVVRTRDLEASNRTLQATAGLRYNEALVRPPSAETFRAELPFQFTVQPGETLSQVLAGLGLPSEDARAVTEVLSEHVEPRRLRAGASYTAYFDRRADLAAFELPLDDRGRLTVRRAARGDWRSSWHAYERTVRLRAVNGVLDGSLDASMRAANASPRVTYLMADALQWDLDFTRDLRQGDEFRVLYEELFVDGRRKGPSRLLALSYQNRGRTLEAYLYGADGGFYDGEGRPLRKMFLRSPLKFSRVTSRFSHRRFHPVLKTYRPHYGVDYGAPIGTPVRVTGSGVVSFAGRNKGAGRIVRVRHPNHYETNYLHLSRLGNGIRPGRRVRQGEVIGYVGSTGLSTAPHLDYRVKVKGKWIDPLTIKSVPARSISEEEKPVFLATRDALRRSLETGEALPTPLVPLFEDHRKDHRKDHLKDHLKDQLKDQPSLRAAARTTPPAGGRLPGR